MSLSYKIVFSCSKLKLKAAVGFPLEIIFHIHGRFSDPQETIGTICTFLINPPCSSVTYFPPSSLTHLQSAQLPENEKSQKCSNESNKIFNHIEKKKNLLIRLKLIHSNNMVGYYINSLCKLRLFLGWCQLFHFNEQHKNISPHSPLLTIPETC